MLKFVQANCTINPAEYDAVARRGNAENELIAVEKSNNLQKPTLVKDPSKGSLAKLPGKPAGLPMPQSFTSLTGAKTNPGLGSRSNTSSTTNLQTFGQKEADVLTDITNFLERQKIDVEKSPLFENMRSERDFYYSKLRDIDHVLDNYKGSDAETLIKSIRDILYLLPEDIAIVCEDGTVKIKTRENEDDVMKEEKVTKNLESQMVIEEIGTQSENIMNSL